MERCGWVTNQDLYIQYHDREWGVPVHDDLRLFEFLVLETSQAGLSWFTILKKRENFRRAFANFEPEKVARFSEKRIEKLMQDAGIIRNRAKIKAAVNNAQKFLQVQEDWGSFHRYSWQFIGDRPIVNHWPSLKKVPVTTKESDAFAKDLKKRGFQFIGSTVMYAHMQAVGMVNDHTTNCFRHKECIT